MRKINPLAPMIFLLVGLLASSVTAAAQSVFVPDRQFTNEVGSARMSLQSQRPGLTPLEINRLAEATVRSNRLAALITRQILDGDFTNAELALHEFPGTVNHLRQYGEPLLLRAVRENKGDAADFLLRHKADPDEKTAYGNTPLMEAIQYRRWNIAAKLVGAGASPTLVGGQRRNAAQMLFNQMYSPGPGESAGNLVSLMLDHGMDPFASAGDGRGLSMVEACLNREDNEMGRGGMYVRLGFVSRGGGTMVFYGDLFLTNRPDPARLTPLGDTALHLAALYGRTNAIGFLLASGFGIHQTNAAGLSPLQAAATAPFDPAVADYLLAKGARLDVFSAAAFGRTNELAALLATNARLANAADSRGLTPLHYAIRLPQVATFGGMVIRANVRSGGKAPPSPQAGVVTLLLKCGADPSAATTTPAPAARGLEAIPAGTTPLHLAARNGDEPIIAMLLAAKANARAADENGDTPLHLAARSWAKDSLASLLGAGAPLEATNRSGRTPLRAAVEARVFQNTGMLLDKGANRTNGLGDTTLLHIAASQGDAATLDVLLKHGFQIDCRDGEGRTPFELAAASRQWDATLLLLEAGADINAADKAGDTALHLVSAQQNDLVFHPAEESSFARWKRKEYYTPGYTGRALAWLAGVKVISPPVAQVYTNSSFTAWLIGRGANGNATNLAGRTPLHVACAADWMRWTDRGQNSNRFNALLEAGARLDLADAGGVTPFHLAVTNASPAMLAFLLPKAGQVVHTADARGRTPLHWAFQSYTENRSFPARETVQMLLTNGADPNAADLEGRTPLHVLMSSADTHVYQYYEMGGLLLEPGWDFSARDRDGQTPIHLWAGKVGGFGTDADAFKFILTNRHWVSLTNGFGDTPLHVAVRSGDPNSARALMEVGANPLLKNARGETALRLAVEKSPSQMDQFVRPQGARNRFFDAIRFHNMPEINLWLAADPGLAALTNVSGTTTLEAASETGDTALMERLIALGATWDAISALRAGKTEEFPGLLAAHSGKPPGDWLFEAVRLGRSREFEAMLQAGADVQCADADGHSLLFRARSGEKNDMAGRLESLGCRETFFDALMAGDAVRLAAFIRADPSCVNARNRNDRTPLYRAAAAGNAAIVRMLLDAGAKADAASSGGWTALHAAAANDSAEIGGMLLKAGASPDAVGPGILSPLQIAAAIGCTNIAETLLENGADINLVPSFFQGFPRNSALHWAAHRGRVEMFALLLLHGADLGALNGSNQTPLDLARAHAINWGFNHPPETRANDFNRKLASKAQRKAILLSLEEIAANHAKK